MTAGWLWLVAAGAVEIGWSQSVKPTVGLTRLVPTVICLVLVAAIILLLGRAMDSGIPVGTAYAVFTGIGAIGAIGLGVALHHDPLTAVRLTGLVMIVGGVVVCRFAEA